MRCLIAQIRCHLNRRVTLTSMEAPSPCQACRNDQPPSGSPAKPVQVGSVSLKRLTDVWFMSKHWCVYLTCMQHVVTAHWTLTYLHFIYPVHMKHCCSVCLFFLMSDSSWDDPPPLPIQNPVGSLNNSMNHKKSLQSSLSLQVWFGSQESLKPH